MTNDDSLLPDVEEIIEEDARPSTESTDVLNNKPFGKELEHAPHTRRLLSDMIALPREIIEYKTRQRNKSNDK